MNAQADPSKEELILRAAGDVFIEKGLSGARMQEIADRAGINKTLLHYYFRTKKNIYARILGKVFSAFFSQIEEAFGDGSSFAAVLRQFIDRLLDLLAANPRVPLFLMQELASGGTIARDILVKTLARQRMTLPKRLIALIEQERRAGHLRPVEPIQFMITVLGACIYFFAAEPIIREVLVSIRPGKPFDRKAFLAQRRQSIFDVLYYGVKKREQSP
jgi:TetR/AcrR family transcriptional regulator